MALKESTRRQPQVRLKKMETESVALPTTSGPAQKPKDGQNQKQKYILSEELSIEQRENDCLSLLVDICLTDLKLVLGPELRIFYPWFLDFAVSGELELIGTAHPKLVKPKGVLTFENGEVNLAATQGVLSPTEAAKVFESQLAESILESDGKLAFRRLATTTFETLMPRFRRKRINHLSLVLSIGSSA